MNLQELPKTAATTALKLAGKAREVVEKRFGGGNGADAKAAATKPAAKKPTAASAASSPTPTNTASAAERSGVIAEQTDGLDDAIDRTQPELHNRDVDVNDGQ